MNKKFLSIIIAAALITGVISWAPEVSRADVIDIPGEGMETEEGVERGYPPGEVIVEWLGTGLSIGECINLNINLGLSDEATDGGTMKITVGDHVYENVPVNRAGEFTYYVSCPVNTLEMAAPITAEYLVASEKFTSPVYSVKQYLDYIISGKYDDSLKMLAKKITNFGYYSQQYLASVHNGIVIGDEGYPAVTGYGGDAALNADAVKGVIKDNFKYVRAAGISLTGRSLNLDGYITLNYYVKTDDGSQPSAACDGEKTVTVKKYKDNEYIVTVNGIKAIEFDTPFTVTVNGMELKGSVMDFAACVIKTHNVTDASKNDIRAVNAMAALYEYYDAAMKGIGNSQEES